MSWRAGHTEPYGLVPAHFEFVVEPGYSAIVGPNNGGKSSILPGFSRHHAATDLGELPKSFKEAAYL